MLSEKGLPIVDADLIARQVVEPGTAVMQQIEEAFGKDVIHPDGTLNREQLGAIIFDNAEKRDRLNNIMHPAIRAEMLRQKEAYIKAGEKTVIMDIPLLFESNLQSYVEKIIVVAVTPPVQKERLMKRNGLTDEEATARISSQIPVAEKVEVADAVIDNDGTIEETRKQLLLLMKEWDL